MRKTKRKFVRYPETIARRQERMREIRDIYSKLRKKYRSNVVEEFFIRHYFIRPATLEKLIRQSDNLPVDPASASLQYQQAMSDNFTL
jgi:hypothetical protein